MDQLEATPIRGTNVTPVGPFFSSDGQSIAFFSNNQLKKIAVNGGAPLTVTDTPSPFGGSWSGDSILLGAGTDGIYRVPAAGGPRERIISVQAGEQAHGPQFLSDGNTVLFTLRSGTATWDDAQIVAQSLDTGERRVLVESGRDARYLPTGHLIYARLGTLFSVAFDPERLAVSGAPVSWVDGVADAAGIGTGAVHYTVSANGTLVYVPSGAGNLIGRRLVWVDRQGNEEPIDTPPHLWSHLRISPEGSRVAIEALDEERDIWVWDFTRAVLSRLTFDPMQTRVPVWLNRERVTYMTQASAGAQFGGILARAANGTGAVENLIDGPNVRNPSSVSPDGKWLVFSESTPSGIDVAMLSLDADRRVQVLLKTPFDEQNGEVSPDGKWLAYQSNESGANEVYVRPFPDVDRGRWQISSGGGTRPVWSRNGTELFYYVESGKMMAVPIATTSGSAFTLGNATVLFEGSYLATGGDRNYDVAIDGKRFLMVKQTGTADESPRIVVVEHWFEELKRRVQTN
jgi:serine/threonine-protein kinase